MSEKFRAVAIREILDYLCSLYPERSEEFYKMKDSELVSYYCELTNEDW